MTSFSGFSSQNTDSRQSLHVLRSKDTEAQTSAFRPAVAGPVSQEGHKIWNLNILLVDSRSCLDFSFSDTLKKLQPYKGRRGRQSVHVWCLYCLQMTAQELNSFFLFSKYHCTNAKRTDRNMEEKNLHFNICISMTTASAEEDRKLWNSH